jgi:hypothetical protein
LLIRRTPAAVFQEDLPGRQERCGRTGWNGKRNLTTEPACLIKSSPVGDSVGCQLRQASQIPARRKSQLTNGLLKFSRRHRNVPLAAGRDLGETPRWNMHTNKWQAASPLNLKPVRLSPALNAGCIDSGQFDSGQPSRRRIDRRGNTSSRSSHGSIGSISPTH